MVLPLRKSIPPPRLMGTSSPGPSAGLKDRRLPADAGFPHILFQRFSAHPRPIFRGTPRRSSGCSPCLQKRGTERRLHAPLRSDARIRVLSAVLERTARYGCAFHTRPYQTIVPIRVWPASPFGRTPQGGNPPRGFPPTPNHSRPYPQSRDERRPAQRCAGIDSGR